MGVDIYHEQNVRMRIDHTGERFGRLDVAINNASTEDRPGPLTEQLASRYGRNLQGQRSGHDSELQARVAVAVGPVEG